MEAERDFWKSPEALSFAKAMRERNMSAEEIFALVSQLADEVAAKRLVKEATAAEKLERQARAYRSAFLKAAGKHSFTQFSPQEIFLINVHAVWFLGEKFSVGEGGDATYQVAVVFGGERGAMSMLPRNVEKVVGTPEAEVTVKARKDWLRVRQAMARDALTQARQKVEKAREALREAERDVHSAEAAVKKTEVAESAFTVRGG